MSRWKSGVQLPHSLQRELGLNLRNARGKGKYTVGERRDQRKASRIEKRENGRGGAASRYNVGRSQRYGDNEYRDNLSETEVKIVTTRPKPVTSSKAPPKPYPQSTLKQTKPRSPSPDSFINSHSDASPTRELSPEVVLDPNSRSYKDRLAEDDDEIAALEKKLGLKNKKKTTKALEEFGLGDVLEGFDDDDDDDEGRKRKREESEWLQRKRRRKEEHETKFESESSGSNGSLEEGLGMSIASSEDEEDEAETAEAHQDDTDSFSGFDAVAEVDENQSPPPQTMRIRENPYVPPVAPKAASTKYMPPSMRKAQDEDDQSLQRLKRQLQGQLNKLSEANLISILDEIENIYRLNARQDVTSTLIDLLLALLFDRAALQTTFVLLHAAFCVAVYKVTGTDFGAELLARLVDRFSEFQKDTSSAGKEALNLTSLLSHLFTFHLTSSNLIYSYINQLLTPLSESNTELLLRLIRDCGPQLRTEDPSSLKAVVAQTQLAAQSLTSPISVRTQFMLETITDLKNNKMRDSTATSLVTREHITKLRKTLGTLNSRSLRATEPLRLTLEDLRNSDRKGKWWLVGASWKGNSPPPVPDSTTLTLDSQPNSTTFPEYTEIMPDYRSLAASLHLNTPLQISILTAITSAQTANDAFIRLAKLRLKRAQESEVSRVLVRCCGAEDSFNQYYADLVRKLCTSEHQKQWKKIFEFALWGFFRKLGDGTADGDDDEFSITNDDGDADGDDIEMRELYNIAILYANLIFTSTLSLSILRPLDILMLSEKASMFVEVLLINILLLCKGDEKEIGRVIGKLRDAKQVVGRVRVFLEKTVKRSDLVTKKERDVVRRGVKIATGVLEELGGGRRVEW